MVRPLRNGRATAVATATAPVRCGVYARVSTEAQAEQKFSSVEVQRETCRAYVNLHRDEGWVVAPEVYEDPGFTGANTNRPGLQRLLADIEAGNVDCVVVHKFDRLSRSMLDFLQLLDFFKRHRVSFVSVSQRFDTSTPVGEMTLNILLSFAQFERQIIGERTRDKIRAARRKGRWTGGFVPLGFDSVPEGGRIVVNTDEAEQVRAMFELYVATPSLVAVSQELNRRGWRQKSWTTKTGKARQGRQWDRVTLRQVLTDVRYVGMQTLGDESFRGEHDAIVPKRLFDQVQKLLSANRSTHGGATRNCHGALLRGLLRCTACARAMTHAPARAHGRLYRYYRCTGAQKEGATACPSKPIPAEKIEAFVVAQIRRIGADPTLQEETFTKAVEQVKAERRGLRIEAVRLGREIETTRGEVERLVAALTRSDGPAADAIRVELGKAQERLGTLEARQREVTEERSRLDALDVDPADVARALEAFDPIWDVLLTPERERVLALLIERIDYDGPSGKLEIHWRLAGFGSLADEIGGRP